MTEEEISFLQFRANEIRKLIFRSAWRANGGHVAPSFSCTEIIATLYFGINGGVLKYDPTNPDWIDRDYFIMSKGHGGLAQYAALAIAGYFSMSELDNFCAPYSSLGSLATIHIPGVEATTGSLGHGLSFGQGIALACKKDNAKKHVYVLLGDGECEEGSIWEAFIAAVHFNLDNLTIIIDCNKFQAMDRTEDILSFGKLVDKGNAFGLKTIEIDGHDFNEIKTALCLRETGCPVLVVANTVKGKGISFMENKPLWHYRIPNEEELEIAMKELGMTKEELGKHRANEAKVYI